MNSKIKILIGVLVVGIVLAAGWWVWENKKPEQISKKYCEQDSDCGWGTIQGDPLEYGCILGGTGKGPSNFKCICNKSRIPSRCEEYEILPEEIAITTDKTEYEQGETVKITVRNSLNKSIWDFASCGGMPFWNLQKFDGSEWKELSFSLPYLEKGKEVCDFILCEKPEITELEPSSEIHYNWPLASVCEWPLQPIGVPTTEPKIIKEGTYKIFLIYGFSKDFSFPEGETIYSNEFTIKDLNIQKNPQTECLGSCRCMKECNGMGPTYFIPVEEGSSECSVNSINKICCCSGV